jgi:predicted amidohydrolase
MNSYIQIAGLQYDIVWEDKKANFQIINRLVSKIRFQSGIIILPETFATGFTMKSEEFSENRLGETESFLLEVARKTGNLIGGSWIEKNPEGMPYNCFSIARPSGIISNRYRKIHPFSLADEDKFFTAGESVEILEWNGFKISLQICYDLRFPELFRKTAGTTDIYMVIANWPTARIEHWRVLLKARAIENQAYVLGVNRIGFAGRKNLLEHTGYTSLFDMNGIEKKVLENEESILEDRISLKEIREFREKLPFLKDRRKGIY